MKRRGHNAYINVDLNDVKERAKALPENDIPPEIVRLLPLDSAHDKLQPNKNATPVPREGTLEEVQGNMNVFRINAVVSEQSTSDVGDEPAQVRACLENTVRKLQKDVACDKVMSECERPLTVSAEDSASGTDNVVVERIAVRTGNAMLDQFEPYYWGVAFAFYFHV